MFGRRTNGQDPVAALRGEVERLFNDFAEELPLDRFFGGSRGFPALNVWEDSESLRLEAELPGLKMNDLEIFVVGNELTIKGARRDEPRADVAYHRRERGTGAFTRVVRLPAAIEADAVSAALRDGVLSITLPKAREARPRKIEVKASN
jgi:HSP20 family protein